MNRPIRVLFVEGSPEDEERILHALRQGGLDPVWKRVEKADGSIATNAAEVVVHIPNSHSTQFHDPSDQQTLLSLVQHSQDFIALADIHGQITFMNSSGRRMIGIGEFDDLREMVFTDYIPLEWQEFFHNTVIRTAREHGLWEGEMQLRNVKTGDIIDVFRSTFTIPDPSGGDGSFATVTRNITESKRAENAIREREAQYRLLFESNPHPMWVYDLETLGFLDVNETAIQHYGYSRDEFLGMTICDIRPPEDVPKLLAAMSRQTTRRTQSTLWRHRKKNGILIDVEISSNDIRYGRRIARFVLALDVTERLRLEREMLRTANLLKVVADGTPDAIYIKDRVGQYSLFNQAAASFVGKPVEEVIGRNDTTLFNSTDAQIVMDHDRRVMETGCVAMHEEELTAAGVTRTYLVTKAPPTEMSMAT